MEMYLKNVFDCFIIWKPIKVNNDIGTPISLPGVVVSIL